MDSMVVMLTSLCSQISKITITRVVNLSKRRKALQKKMCVGYDLQEFNKIGNNFGHVGLEESAMMLSDSLNMKLKMTMSYRPVMAKRNLHSNGTKVNRGRIAGIHHSLVAKRNNSKFLNMHLYMYVGAKEYDMIEIKGIPPVHIKTKGVSGDKSTIALLSNYIPIILERKPGLYTVNQLPIPSFKFY
ncbi:MAG: hypothetical protein ACE5EJ_07045 [Nitrosopumilaceae archaeon]